MLSIVEGRVESGDAIRGFIAGSRNTITEKFGGTLHARKNPLPNGILNLVLRAFYMLKKGIAMFEISFKLRRERVKL